MKGVSTTRNGWPKVLGSRQREEVSCNDRVILRLQQTILFSTRAQSLGKLPNFTTITEAPINGQRLDSYGLMSFWSSLGYHVGSKDVPNSLRWRKFHFSSKAGPIGHALASSLYEVFTLPEAQIENLKLLGGDELFLKIKAIRDNPDIIAAIVKITTSVVPTAELLRKIVFFPDKELKVRVVAEQDYWSQTALRPLHSWTYRVQRKIPQDCTFDQGSFKTKIENWEVFHSIDLSAFTDRFPIKFVSIVLKGVLPKFYVEAWEYVMIGLPFKSAIGYISYATGTPMGAYSSWATTSLAHHFVMFQSCADCGIPWDSAPYVLLGDDLMIGDTKLMEAYRARIKSLGVEVSSEKTFSSKFVGEFAKRLFYKCEEISPFPISGLSSVATRSYLMVNYLIDAEIKGWKSVKGIPASVGDFYEHQMGYRSARVNKLLLESSICELMIKTMRGGLLADASVNEIVRQLNLRLPPLSQEICNNILSNMAVESFAESNPENDNGKSGKSLGAQAEACLLFLTGIGEDRPVAYELIYAIPVLGVYGLIEESFMNQKRLAIRIDTKGEDWPILLRAMTQPMSDQIFVRKSDHLVPTASFVIGKRLIERLRLLEQYPSLLGQSDNTLDRSDSTNIPIRVAYLISCETNKDV